MTSESSKLETPKLNESSEIDTVVPTFSIEQFLHSTTIKKERIPSYVKFLSAWGLEAESDLPLLTRDELDRFEVKYKSNPENKDIVLPKDVAAIVEAAQSYGKVAIRKRKLEIQKAVETGKDVIKRVKSLQLHQVQPTTFVELPTDPFLFQSQRTRFAFAKGNTIISTMHRKCTEDMLKFVQTRGQSGVQIGASGPQGPLISALYIHGPRGVGKSYSLFEVVCHLRADSKNRVIYIPDCGGWGAEGPDTALDLLIRAICFAFSEDEEILEYCDTVPLEEKPIKDLLNTIPEYCTRKQLNLFAIFDQHNGLTVEQRKEFPFRIIERDLPSASTWKNALVVVAASANNEYYLKVASDNNWPQFIMNNGYDEEEFQAWVKVFKFFEGDSGLEDIQYWTRCVPYDLKLFLDVRDTNPNANLMELMNAYKLSKGREILAQQEKFEKEHLVNETLTRNALEAVTIMMLDLPTANRSYRLNQQLMYEENDRIYPINPFAAEKLKSHWGLSLDSAVENTFKTAFEASKDELTFTNDVRGRLLELYVLSKIEHYKFFKATPRVINSTKISDVWDRTSFNFSKLIVQHFAGQHTIPKFKNPAQENYLYIPDVANYPGLDAVFWDHTTSTLMPVSFTISDVCTHSNHFPNKKSQWIKMIQDKGVKTVNVKFLWICISDKITNGNLNGNWLLLADELDKTCFPMLDHWNYDL